MDLIRVELKSALKAAFSPKKKNKPLDEKTLQKVEAHKLREKEKKAALDKIDLWDWEQI